MKWKKKTKTCWSTFKYFIILNISTYYMLCISWIIKCFIIIDARCKHEDCVMVSKELHLCHTCNCICVTRAIVFVSHVQLYLCHTCNCICVTRAIAFVSHVQLYLCHTCNCICVTRAIAFVSHVQLHLCHTCNC